MNSLIKLPYKEIFSSVICQYSSMPPLWLVGSETSNRAGSGEPGERILQISHAERGGGKAQLFQRLQTAVHGGPQTMVI